MEDGRHNICAMFGEEGKHRYWRKYSDVETAKDMLVLMKPWERIFVGEVLKGTPYREAFRKAGKGDDRTRMTLRCERYLELAKKEADALAADLHRANILSSMERREFLADVVRTPISECDDDSPLLQTKTVRTDKQGNETTSYTMPDKIKAVELDAKLAGDLSSGGAAVEVPALNFSVILQSLPDTSGLPSMVKSVLPAETVVKPEALPSTEEPGVATAKKSSFYVEGVEIDETL